jgi:hypothetical protein
MALFSCLSYTGFNTSSWHGFEEIPKEEVASNSFLSFFELFPIPSSNWNEKTPFLLQKWGLNSSPDHISTFGLKVNDGWPQFR